MSEMILNHNFDRVIHINTKQLSRLTTSLLQFAEYFEVQAWKKKLQFSFQNNNSFVQSGSVTIGEYSSVSSNREIASEESDSKYASVTFMSVHMCLLQKCLSIYPVCNMYLATDTPMVIEMHVNELGKLKLAVAPVAQSCCI